MKVRLSTLRRIIKEVALSPATFTNNEPTRDPFDRPNVAKAVQALENAFVNGVKSNLYLANRDKYNEETREFDDATNQHIEEAAKHAAEAMMAGVHKAVQQAWAQAVKGAKAAPESGVVSKEQPPKKAVA